VNVPGVGISRLLWWRWRWRRRRWWWWRRGRAAGPMVGLTIAVAGFSVSDGVDIHGVRVLSWPDGPGRWWSLRSPRRLGIGCRWRRMLAVLGVGKHGLCSRRRDWQWVAMGELLARRGRGELEKGTKKKILFAILIRGHPQSPEASPAPKILHPLAKWN
jgi:hypothetical protein